jgi:hypothetical protein
LGVDIFEGQFLANSQKQLRIKFTEHGVPSPTSSACGGSSTPRGAARPTPTARSTRVSNWERGRAAQGRDASDAACGGGGLQPHRIKRAQSRTKKLKNNKKTVQFSIFCRSTGRCESRVMRIEHAVCRPRQLRREVASNASQNSIFS